MIHEVTYAHLVASGPLAAVMIANAAKLLDTPGASPGCAVVCPDVPRRIDVALHQQGFAAHPSCGRLGASGDG